MKFVHDYLQKWRDAREQRNIELSRKKAVSDALHYHKQTKGTYVVLFVKGRFRCYSRQVLKNLIAQKYFERGITIEHLEKKALFIAK
jgi:dTDP-4-dehydrorhamnose 3,5-epimerase-like enzyme